MTEPVDLTTTTATACELLDDKRYLAVDIGLAGWLEEPEEAAETRAKLNELAKEDGEAEFASIRSSIQATMTHEFMSTKDGVEAYLTGNRKKNK